MKKITEETQIKKAIKDYLSLDGWFHFPIMQGMGCYPGLPDRMAFKYNYCLLIEIKSKKGKLSDNQIKLKERIDNLKSDTIFYIVVRSVEDLNSFIENLTGVKKFLFEKCDMNKLITETFYNNNKRNFDIILSCRECNAKLTLKSKKKKIKGCVTIYFMCDNCIAIMKRMIAHTK